MGLHASPTELKLPYCGASTAGECRYLAVLGIPYRQAGGAVRHPGEMSADTVIERESLALRRSGWLTLL